jgi:hypothetical protein
MLKNYFDVIIFDYSLYDEFHKYNLVLKFQNSKA